MALKGIRVVEIAGLAPAPFAGLCLADFGASVIRIDRSKNGSTVTNLDTLSRGKRSIALDLKSQEGLEVFKTLISKSDVLIEPFRPGVMEKLGLGPDVLLALNPRLVYARMTGFGQGGDPLVERAAGHDTNYIALSGVLSTLRSQGQKPQPPVNLLGDFGGGGLICAFGILLALMERNNSGKGQVVDAAMVDGAAYLASSIFSSNAVGAFGNDLDTAGTNLLDGGAHFYQTYECKDGNFMSIGAIEPQFYAELLKGMGLDEKRDNLPKRMDSSQWPQMKERFTKIFLTKTRDEWADIYRGKDACAFPILTLQEAISNKHNVARGTFIKKEESIDTYEPAAAPKLSRTPAHGSRPMPVPGSHTHQILTEVGFSTDQIQRMLKSKNVVADKQSKL